MSHHPSALMALCLALATTPASAQMVRSIDDSRSTSTPDVGAETTVGPGETILSLAVESCTRGVKDGVYLERDLVTPDISLPTGTFLVNGGVITASSFVVGNGAKPGFPMYCSESNTFVNGNPLLGGAKRLLCFQDLNGDGTLEHMIFKKYRKPTQFAALPVKSASEDIPDSRRCWKSFRRELRYQGAGGGVLRLLYREFVDDMARPAFSEELTYDIEKGVETTIRFRGASIRVLSAGNEGIRYVVEAPLAPAS